MPDHKRITLSEELDGLKRKGNAIFNGNKKCGVNLKMSLWDFDNIPQNHSIRVLHKIID